MVAQPHHESHTSQTPSQTPPQIPHIIIIHDPTIIAYLRHAARSTPLHPLQQPTKKMSNKPKGLIAHFLSPLRCGRDSNSRPHAWQACILTRLNYRTVWVCNWGLFLNCDAKVICFFETTKYFEDFFQKNQLFSFYPAFLLGGAVETMKASNFGLVHCSSGTICLFRDIQLMANWLFARVINIL